jgi:hypothetical protein
VKQIIELLDYLKKNSCPEEKFEKPEASEESASD